MKWFSAKFTIFALALFAVTATPMTVVGQTNNGTTNNGTTNGGGDSSAGGIYIDPNGTLKETPTITDRNLLKKRLEIAKAKISKDIAKVSTLRKVSLKRLHAEMSRLKAEGKKFPEDMLYMAGLTSITHVFCYPEAGDIVLAGPAEGYFADNNGFVRGMKSGQSTLQLQDLVAALRAYPQNGRTDTKIACSIDPTKEGLQRLSNFTGRIRNIRRNQVQQVKMGVKNALGMQSVRVEGVSPKSHLGHVLVLADYQMKLMGLGLKRVKGLIPYVSKVKAGSANGISRWFFVPKYDGVRVSEDGLAMKLEGNGVQLLTEAELVDRFGNRRLSNRKDKASKIFTESFTKNYKKIELANPIFGELSNVMDMAIVAAFVQSRDYYSLANLDLTLINSEKELPIENRREIKQVESVVTALFRGGRLITPISGGVTINAHRAVSEENVKVDESGDAEKKRDAIKFAGLAEGQWWWD